MRRNNYRLMIFHQNPPVIYGLPVVNSFADAHTNDWNPTTARFQNREKYYVDVYYTTRTTMEKKKKTPKKPSGYALLVLITVIKNLKKKNSNV